MYIYLKYQALQLLSEMKSFMAFAEINDLAEPRHNWWIIKTKVQRSIMVNRNLNYQCIKKPIEARYCCFSRYLKTFLDQYWPILVNHIWTLMLEAWSRIFCYDLVVYSVRSWYMECLSFYQTLCYMDINKTKNNFKLL